MKSKVMLMNAVAVAISLLMILGCAGHQHNDSVGDLIANA